MKRCFTVTTVLALLTTSCERHDHVAMQPDVIVSAPAPPDTTPVAAKASAPVAEITDTAPPTSDDDLAELSAQLDVPVQGVARSELHDSYAEARGGRVHEALDIMAARGTHVLSAADGRLLKMFDSKPGGLMVYAADASGRFILLYGHLDRYEDGLVEGMHLTRGQQIGYVGTTGNAQAGAPHLHFAVLRADPSGAWWKGVAVNPYPLLVHRHD